MAREPVEWEWGGIQFSLGQFGVGVFAFGWGTNLLNIEICPLPFVSIWFTRWSGACAATPDLTAPLPPSATAPP